VEWSLESAEESPELGPEFGAELETEKGSSPDITPPLECCVLEARDMSDWNVTEHMHFRALSRLASKGSMACVHK
jgi:hypothetical protein